MRSLVLDPGHKYSLASLDGEHEQILQFVKRVGDKYPGNLDTYPGTTIQEVVACLINRCVYVNTQTPCAETESVIHLLRTIILLLEHRAAVRHNRTFSPPHLIAIEQIDTCATCGHIECKGH